MTQQKRTPIVAPSASKETVASEAPQIGQDHVLNVPTTGDARIEGGLIEPVPSEALADMDKLDLLRFNEDLLEVMVFPNNDPLAKPIVSASVNGRNQFFVRGRRQHVRRKFVEALARAKTTRFTSDVKLDPTTNEYINNLIPKTGVEDNFTVLHDPAGQRGAEWLQTVLAEA